MLSNEHASYRSGAAMVAGSRKLGDAKPQLLHLLSDSDEDVRISAAGALLELDDTSGVGVLNQSLLSESDFKKLKAAGYLVTTGDNRAIEVATGYLSSKNASHRGTAVRALGKSKDEAVAISALSAGLTDTEGQVRLTAIFGLGRRAGTQSITLLRKVLTTFPDASDRTAAVTALRTQGTPEVIPLLIDALEDESEIVTTASQISLKRLTKRDPIPVGSAKSKAADWRAWWAEHKQNFQVGVSSPK